MNPRLNKSRTKSSLVRDKSVTLLELLIALVLMSLIVLGFSSIDLFSRYHVITSDRRVKIQNEASLGLEHMTKQISRAIGNEIADGANQVVDTTAIAGDPAIRVYVDANGNGKKDSSPSDYWIAYRFTGATGNPNTQYQIWYYSNYVNPGSPYETIARNITLFTPIKPINSSNQLNNNFITIQLTACWNPATAVLPNGAADNPCVSMNTNIKMPSVSAN